MSKLKTSISLMSCRCGMCGSECEGAGAGSSVHLSSPDKGESVFCSDHCFALHRRQVYRQSGPRAADSAPAPAAPPPPRPRLSVKPDHLLKMSARERQRQSARHALDPGRGQHRPGRHRAQLGCYRPARSRRRSDHGIGMK